MFFFQIRKTCSSCCDDVLDADDGGRSTFKTRSVQLSITGNSWISAAVWDDVSLGTWFNDDERRENVIFALSVVWTNDCSVDEAIEAVSSMMTSSRLAMELSRCLLAKRRKTYWKRKRATDVIEMRMMKFCFIHVLMLFEKENNL